MLKLEPGLDRVWLQAVTACLSSGQKEVAESAIRYGDEIVLAYETRFSPPSEDRICATYSVDQALRYYERAALVGKQVIIGGTSDVPPMGRLKDFTNGEMGAENMALVVWESGGPVGVKSSWVRVDQLQLIAQFR